jgi:hypothetical protein
MFQIALRRIIILTFNTISWSYTVPRHNKIHVEHTLLMLHFLLTSSYKSRKLRCQLTVNLLLM